jgi:hypothetical protein
VTRGKRRARRLLWAVARIVSATVVAIALAALAAALFVGIECYSPSRQAETPPAEPAVTDLPGYAREEAATFLTLPEWYIVYNTGEYARFIGGHAPSQFPYLRSIAQYWRYYAAVCGATKGVYPFSAGNHLMLAIIGASFSIEYGLKALYEGTVGRTTEWFGGFETSEDAFAHATAVEYGAFMHTVPWYEFPFRAKLAALWRGTPLVGPHSVRKWERRVALSGEYAVKGAYGWLIGRGSQATYGDEDLRIHARIENAADAVFADPEIRKVKSLGPGSFIVTIPRYEAFTHHTLRLLEQALDRRDLLAEFERLRELSTRRTPRE